MFPSRGTDFFWQLRTGQQILVSGPPHHDPFTWTRLGKEWRVNEWLFFGLLALAFRDCGGLSGVFWLYLALLSTLGITLFICIERACKSLGFSLLLSSLALAALCPYLAPRPQLISYIFLAITCAVSSAIMEEDLPAVVGAGLVPMFALWSNLHQGVVIGVAILVIQAMRGISPARRRSGAILAMVAGACLTMTLVTPYGVGLYKLIMNTLTQPAAMQVDEWRPYVPQTTPADIALIILCLLAATGIALRRSSEILWELALLLIFLVEAYCHARNIPLAVIVMSVALWKPIQVVVLHCFPCTALKTCDFDSKPASSRRATLVGLKLILGAFGAYAILGVTIPSALILIGSGGANLKYSCVGYDRFPWEAVSFLNYENFPVGLRQYNDYPLGGMLGYARPKQLVFIDSRADICDGELLREVLSITNPDRMREPLTRDETSFIGRWDFDDAIVTAPRLAFYLACQPDWSLVYVHHIGPVFDRDHANAWIFVRRRHRFVQLIEKGRLDWSMRHHGVFPIVGY